MYIRNINNADAATADKGNPNMSMTNEQKLQALLTEARTIQIEQSLLIKSRTNPTRFGQLERRLEGPTGIWQQVNALRAASGR